MPLHAAMSQDLDTDFVRRRFFHRPMNMAPGGSPGAAVAAHRNRFANCEAEISKPEDGYAGRELASVYE
jgi:hypothetical protein